MRLAGIFSLLVALTGICAAQDTNFPVGPQYLITNGSPYLLQPIATPTLSFTAPPVSSLPAEGEASGGEQVVYTPPRASATDFSGSSRGGSNIGENAGDHVSEIGLTSEEASALPAGVINVGVTEIVDPLSLRENSFGMTLAQAAAFWKTHKTPVSHVYTNADIARLHGG